MLYTKVQPHSFLGSAENLWFFFFVVVFLPCMDMTGDWGGDWVGVGGGVKGQPTIII